MAGKRIRLRYGHAPGKCGLVVMQDGQGALTSGADSLVQAVRYTLIGKGDTARSIQELTSIEVKALADIHQDAAVGCLALSPDGKVLATGDDEAFVRLFRLPKGHDSDWESNKDVVLESVAARFQAPIRALAFAPTGALLAAAGDEPGLIKLISVGGATPPNVMKSSDAMKGGDAVCYLSYDPQSDFVMSVGSKTGVVSLWMIEENIYDGNIDFGPGVASCAEWSPDGNSIAVGSSNGLVICDRCTRKPKIKFEGGHSRNAEIVSISWSPNGLYLLSSDNEGQVVLWDVAKRESLDRWQADHPIQIVKWNPKANAAMLLDTIGQYGMIDELVPNHMPQPWISDEEDAVLAKEPGPETLFDDEIAKEFDVDGHRKGAKSSKKGFDERDTDAEMDDDEDSENESELPIKRKSSKPEKKDYSKRKSGSTERDDARNGSDASEESEDESPDETESKYSKGYRKSSHRRNKKTRHASKKLQEPFVPSSTPDNGRRRILCWNLSGVIQSENENTHNSIEITFSSGDQAAVRFKDHYGFTQGALGPHGAVFASPPSPQHESTLFYRPFESWSKNAEWTVKLPSDETSKCVAIGSAFVACASSNHVVRIFTPGGIQTDLFPIPGPIVTMTASESRLCLVYGLGGDLYYELLEINSYHEVSRTCHSGPLCLTPGSVLSWVGFATRRGVASTLAGATGAQGTNQSLATSCKPPSELVVYDNLGRISVLFETRGSFRWTILLQDTAKVAKAAFFWLAAIRGNEAIGVPCHGIERYPSTSPRPLFTTIPLSIPLIDNAHSGALFKSRMAMASSSWSLDMAETLFSEESPMYLDLCDDLTDAEYTVDKVLLQLIDEACRAGRGVRALELIVKLHRVKSLEIAYQLATHYKLPALADRISKIMAAKPSAQHQGNGPVSKKNNRGRPRNAPPSGTRPAVLDSRTGKSGSAIKAKGSLDNHETEAITPAKANSPDHEPVSPHEEAALDKGSEKVSIIKKRLAGSAR